jgi:predicted transcriptional regulator
VSKPSAPKLVDPRVLASPVRAEMIGVLQSEGPRAIRELAAMLARPADGLYHHMRVLLKAGLIQERERRKSGQRDEIVYALTAPRAAGDPRKVEDRPAVVAAAQTALRMAGREFAAAIAACPPRAPLAGPRLSRQRVWLSPEGLRSARRLLVRLEELLARENRRHRGALHVVTTVVVPLVPRRRS